MQFQLFIFYKPAYLQKAYLQKIFHGRLLSIRADGVSPRMNTIPSRDQFQPIRIGENLVVNYNNQLDFLR